MGKGDQKSRKGKISSGSYGVTRKKKKAATFVAKPSPKKVAAKKEEAPTEKVTAKKVTPKKAAAKK
tara:strand:- start:121 stop:318 length:198 start_codon:yes stop_codon:yes gene_type:complete